MLLPMFNLAIAINMINDTLLACQHIDRPLQMVPHVDRDLDLGAREFGVHELAGLGVSGQEGPENGQVRTLRIVEDPANEAVTGAERLGGDTC